MERRVGQGWMRHDVKVEEIGLRKMQSDVLMGIGPREEVDRLAGNLNVQVHERLEERLSLVGRWERMPRRCLRRCYRNNPW